MTIFLTQQHFLFVNNCYFEIIKSFPKSSYHIIFAKITNSFTGPSNHTGILYTTKNCIKIIFAKITNFFLTPSWGLQTTQGPFTQCVYIQKNTSVLSPEFGQILRNIFKSGAEKSQKSWISPLRENRCLVAFLKSAQYILGNVGERENPVFCIIWGKKQELCMAGCTSWYCNICKVCF